MGIKNFFKIVHEGIEMESLGDVKELREFAGKDICIDASWVIYSSLLALSHVGALSDEKGNPTGHINNVIQRVIMYRREGLQQLWIFDNPERNPMKAEEYAQREERRRKSDNEKAQFRMTSKHVRQIIKLLGFMGISYIVAPPGVEAEHYGACLCKAGLCNMMLSGDSDVLVFGGKLLRQYKVKTPGKKTKKTVYQLYDPDIIMGEYELSERQFAEVAVALGSDFAPKVRGIGPKTVIKRVINGNIAFDKQQEKVVDYIIESVKMCPEDLHESDFDEERFKNYLLRRGFDEERIEKFIKELLN